MSDATPSTFPTGTILGYPRIGPGRELKKALESFWKGATSQADLEAAAATLRAGARERMSALGLDRTNAAIPSNFSFYDHMLDATVTFGAIPSRFAHLRDTNGAVDLAGYSVIARGEGDKAPLEMTSGSTRTTTTWFLRSAPRPPLRCHRRAGLTSLWRPRTPAT